MLSVESGSLILTLQCPTLESLERLWNDYRSGYLDEIAERFLVTYELKRKVGLDNVRFKITIEEENYLICKDVLLEKLGKLSSIFKLHWETLGSFVYSYLFSLSKLTQDP